MAYYSFTMASGNTKTGPMPVSMSPKESCPPTCPLKAKGCYAEVGRLNIHWQRLESKGLTWDDLIGKIKTIPRGLLWRHNQAGDLPNVNGKVDAEKLTQLVEANQGKRGFTYSHVPLTQHNTAEIRKANQAGFTINLSADNAVEADLYAETGAGPVATVLPINAPQTSYTPQGRKIVVCPAQYRDNVQCWTCGLCQKQRSVIVGFRAHGISQKKVSRMASL